MGQKISDERVILCVSPSSVTSSSAFNHTDQSGRCRKADQLIILVYMFIKDGVTLRHGKVPGRVHLERTGTDIVVDPQDALGEFL